MINGFNTEKLSRIRRGRLPKNHFTRSDLTVNDLEMLRNADIMTCNADELVDLKRTEVNRNAAQKQRAGDFIAQVGNPYLFKVDDTVVKVEFGDGKDFSEMLADVILAG